MPFDHEIGEEVLGVPVLVRDTDLRDSMSGISSFVNGIGLGVESRLPRASVFGCEAMWFYFSNLVHPSAAVDTSACLGNGNHIMAQALIGTGARIANNCIVNSGAVVSHDVVLCDNVLVAPGTVLATR